MQQLDLAPASRAEGTLRLPGSKSISNRTLLMAALARGTTELTSLLDSDDTRVMREALAALGVPLESRGSVEHIVVQGIGRASGFPNKKADLFLGNAGTAFRPLTAALALADGHYGLSGVPRMHERPIGDLVDALAQAGAHIEYRGARGFPPLAIAPRSASNATTVRVRGNVSSQFLSATLIALAWTGKRARVEVEGELISKPYVELTLGLMKRFGVEVKREEWSAFEVPEGEGYVSPGALDVEGDASSASYFLAAGAVGGGPVRVEGVGLSSLQGDVNFAHVLEKMGASITMGDNWIESRRVVAKHRQNPIVVAKHRQNPIVVAKHRQNPIALKPFDLDFNLIPDAAMTAAVLALFATGPSRLRNIASWRVKETDRIAAMATELRKFGATVEESPDSLSIKPPADFLASPALHRELVSVDTYDDHRMAMCFSLASFGPRRVRINDPGCVSKTFPTYFDEFRRLVS